MTEKKPRKIFYYARRGKPLQPLQLAKLKPVVDDEVDFIEVEVALQELDEKDFVSTSFCERIRICLTSLGIPVDDAAKLVALRMDHPNWKSLKKSQCSEERRNEKRRQATEHNNRMKAQELEKGRREIFKKTSGGHYGIMGAEFGMWYFFEDKTQYLHLLEDMLKEHHDEYLQIAVDSYPMGKMGWIHYHWSFDSFWIKVVRLSTMEKFDFSEPGLNSVRRLAMYLFTWNFRRYIDGQVIMRHARFLPRLYRHLHVAACLDSNTTVEVDEEYPEATFEDELEEPGDDIGNR